MKKIFTFLFILAIVFFGMVDVNAQVFEVNQLIPVDTTATVKTDNFTYKDFVYNSQVNAKGNSVINFGLIGNDSNKKRYVSINILLFDEKKKNIGFLTYCSEKDLDTDYSRMELKPNQATQFSMNVTKRYFANGNSAIDVKYISVFDDNLYCKIGGYSKYAGLTIDQISDGVVTSNLTEEGQLQKLYMFFEANSVKIIIVSLIITIFVLLVIGSILNALHKRMYAKTTFMAYIPILSNYVSTKMAFGQIVAKIYIIGVGVSFVLSLIGIHILTIFVNLITSASFIIVIIKLITKKYDLFYYEPSIKSSMDLGRGDSSYVSSVSGNSFGVDNSYLSDVSVSLDNKEGANSGDIVDLSYSGDNISSSTSFSESFLTNNTNNAIVSNNTTNSNNVTNNDSVSLGGTEDLNISSGIGDSNTNLDSSSPSISSGKSGNNNSNGESDLSKFFR